MKRRVLSILILGANLLNVAAQNMTSSPVSMFGLGELSTGEGGIYSGLGGVGIALRGENVINDANPASLTGLLPQYFNNLAVGFRIAPRWYGAIFMAPVSSVGYAISLDQDVAGTDGSTVTSLFQGEGGVSKMGISVAYELWKGLSLGTNFSYVGGSISQTETQGSATESNSSHKHTIYADFGLQYTYKLDHYRSVVAGVVYGYSQDLMQDNDHAVSSSSSSGNIEEKGKKYRTCLPQFIGFGASYTTLRWMASIDYKFVDWSRLESSHSSISFRNQHRLMLGGSYTLGNPYSKPVRLLLGAGMGNSYISVHDKTTTNYYLSTGLNFEFRSRSTLSLGVKYTDQLKVNSGRFKEQKLSFFLNLTFSEKTYKAKLK